MKTNSSFTQIVLFVLSPWRERRVKREADRLKSRARLVLVITATVFTVGLAVDLTAAVFTNLLPVQIGANPPTLKYFSNRSMTQFAPEITNILISIHGSSYNPYDYLNNGVDAAARCPGASNSTLVIAPCLFRSSEVQTPFPMSALYWKTSPFWGSAQAAYGYPGQIDIPFSAYAALDLLSDFLVANPNFPNLQRMVWFGHSGGGQLINRYAASSDHDLNATARGLHTRYICSAASSYVYLDESRPDPAVPGHFCVPDPADYPGYNDYGYGLDNLFAYMDYPGGDLLIQNRYKRKCVVYCVGSLDNKTNAEGLDTSAAANLQGTMRLERATNYMAHLRSFYGPQISRFQVLCIVSNVGHTGHGIITSDAGVRSIFDYCDFNPIDQDQDGVSDWQEWLAGTDPNSTGLADLTITGTSGDDTIYFGLVNYGSKPMLGVVKITATTTHVTRYDMGTGRLTINGGDGNDHIEALNGADKEGLRFLDSTNLTYTEIYLYGGNGNDELIGSRKADHLFGEGGNDLLVGGDGNDYLYGGFGNDYLSGCHGDDCLFGMEDDDFLTGDQGNDYLRGEAGDDILVGGSGYGDRLNGGSGDDQWWCREVPSEDLSRWDLEDDESADSDANDTQAPIDIIEIKRARNPYKEWVPMARYGHGIINFHDTTSNPDLLLANRAAGAVLLLSSGGDLPVFGDFDRDGRSDDLALFRPTLGQWAFDYDHDCHTDLITTWGLPGDIPVAGDFDGDGHMDDVAVFRPTNRLWYFDYNHNGTTDKVSGPWGLPGDIPIAGSFDTDGKCDDVGVFRPGTRMWYYDYHANGTTDESHGPWGLLGDVPVVGDFFHTRQNDDVAVFRPSTGQWYYDYQHDGTTDFESLNAWGTWGDIPFTGDLDGDGRYDDVGLFRTGTRMWYFDYDFTARTDAIRGPWGDPGVPLHTTHKQYGKSCGPTSLNMVFKHLGVTDPSLRRWFWRDLDDASSTPVPSTFWPSEAVDVGYHLSMEHIMWEGFRHRRKTDLHWNPPSSFLSADGRLNTAAGSADGTDYDIQYDIGNVNWNPSAEDATGSVQQWLQYCEPVGWNNADQNSGLPYVANKFSQGRNDAFPVRFSFGSNGHFTDLAHLQAVIEGYINHGIPLVVAVENGGHFNTIMGYWRAGSTFYVYTAEPLDGYGRPFYCKPLRWRRIILNEEMLREGSCTLVALMLYGHATPGGGGTSWARQIDADYGKDLLCGYLKPVPPAPPAPRLTIKSSPANSTIIRVQGMPNTTYVLEGTPHLHAPIPWIPITSKRANASGVIEFIDPDMRRFPNRFYRAVIEEP